MIRTPTNIAWITLLFALAADALRGPGTHTKDLLEVLDTDHSGTVNRKEMAAFSASQGLGSEDASAEFARLDANSDGKLTPAELSKGLLGDASDEAISMTGQALTGTYPALPAEQAAALPVAQVSPLMAQPVASQELPNGLDGNPAQVMAAAEQMMQEVSQPAPQVPALELPPVLQQPPAQAVGLTASALDGEARRQAGKALAMVFAETASGILANRSGDVAKAGKLDQVARVLRAQSAEIRRTAAEQTAQAASAAAAEVIRGSAGDIQDLEQEAAKVEKEAAAKHALAKEALDKALRARSNAAFGPATV